MLFKTLIILLILINNFCVKWISGGVLLWSTREFRVSALQKFNNKDLMVLIDQLYEIPTFLYKAPTLFPELEWCLNGHYFFYNVHGGNIDFNWTKSIDVQRAEEIPRKPITSDENYLVVVVVPDKKIKSLKKRQVGEHNQQSEGAIFYCGQSKKDAKYALFYSPQPLELQLLLSNESSAVDNNINSYFLGNTSSDLITVDSIAKDTQLRLSVAVPQTDGVKITLRFLFEKLLNGYWRLTGVRITDNQRLIDHELKAIDGIQAPLRYSYHCSQQFVFKTANGNGAELKINGLQVQIDAEQRRFGDAFDCVPFLTVPILSGILVVALLTIGFLVGLSAIGHIKTMDRFDSQMTRQVVFTCSE